MTFGEVVEWILFLVFGLPVLITFIWGLVTLIFWDTPLMLLAVWRDFIRPAHRFMPDWDRDQ